jgi:hypothetical protein
VKLRASIRSPCSSSRPHQRRIESCGRGEHQRLGDQLDGADDDQLIAGLADLTAPRPAAWKDSPKRFEHRRRALDRQSLTADHDDQCPAGHPGRTTGHGSVQECNVAGAELLLEGHGRGGADGRHVNDRRWLDCCADDPAVAEQDLSEFLLSREGGNDEVGRSGNSGG